MSAEPLPGEPVGGPRHDRARLAPVRTVPPPPATTPFPAQRDMPPAGATADGDAARGGATGEAVIGTPGHQPAASQAPAPQYAAPRHAAPQDLAPHDLAPQDLAPPARPARTEPATVPTPRPDLRPEARDGDAPDAGPRPTEAPRRPSPVPRRRHDAAAMAHETPEAHAARVVRETWAEMEPRIDEVTGWFAALLFSLAPTTRALFPTHVTPPARRLLRSMLLPMTTLDRPHELAGALEPLVAEHRGLGLTAEHYESLGVALIGAMRRFAEDGWGPDTERAWAQAFALVAEPMQDVLRADTSPAVVEAEVVGHRRLGWDLAVVTVLPRGELAWTAGQHVPVEIPARPRMWRPLSPATAPRADGVLEFHVRAVEGGWVSRAMVAHTRPGDVWRLGPPRGRLAIDTGARRDVLMVAGGTGAAPMLSLCEDLAQRRHVPEVTVLAGGRRSEDLYALERFRALSDRAPWLAVAGVCEEDPLTPDVVPGRLPDAVVRAGDWSAHEILLAGSPAMIRATVSALLVDGVGLDRVHYDPFTE